MKLAVLLVAIASVGCQRAPNRCVNNGQIALVFSDGPVRGTPEVMEALQDENISATFMFSTVNLDHMGVTDIITDAIEGKHTVGLRTNPANDFSEMSEEDIRDCITREVEVMEGITNQRLKYITVNQDDVNNPVVLKTIKDLGLLMVNYNYDMYNLDTEADPMIDRWCRKLKVVPPKSASYIVLQHDQRESELGLLPDVVSNAHSAGFEFVNMDTCLDGAEMDGDPDDCDGEGAFIPTNRENSKTSGALGPVTATAICLLGLLVV